MPLKSFCSNPFGDGSFADLGEFGSHSNATSSASAEVQSGRSVWGTSLTHDVQGHGEHDVWGHNVHENVYGSKSDFYGNPSD